MGISGISSNAVLYHSPAPRATQAPVVQDADHDGDTDKAGSSDRDTGRLVNIKA
jgi:hypothetical protein